MAKKWDRWKAQKGVFRIIFRSIGGPPPQLNAQLLTALQTCREYIEGPIRCTCSGCSQSRNRALSVIDAAIAAANGQGKPPE
jgi:hypothetical protein